jgi:uncharacterized membrane protein
MASEFVNPNLHVVLVHFPMAMLIAGVGIELFSFLWPRSSFRTSGRWMILLGALLAVPATFSGIYALSDVARMNSTVGDVPWEDVKAASPWLSQPVIWQMMRNHVIYQSAATGLAVLASVIWLGRSDRFRRIMHWPLMVMLVGSVAILIVGAWNAGELIYHHGVSVQTGAVSEIGDPPKYAFMRFVPPFVELHVIMAGGAIAVALAAIGLSCRKINMTFDSSAMRSDEAGHPASANSTAREQSEALVMIRSFNPGIEVAVHPCAPAARFWGLAFLLALAAAGLGVVVLAGDSDAMAVAKQSHHPVWKVLWEQVKPADGEKVNRALGHVIMGTTIVVMPLILAALARWAPRRSFFFSLFTLILTAAVAAQIWLGVLLLLDTSVGPVNHFNPSEAASPH